MRGKRILILGGTGEALQLAERLVADGYDVTTSLAGVTQKPVTPHGRLRRGGFGGSEGLSAFLETERIAALIDATHPYAVLISQNAAEASRRSGVPVLRLERPAWTPAPQDRWIDVDSVAAAVTALPSRSRAFVTVGRKDIASFFAREDISGVARMIEQPQVAVPPAWALLLARPPFTCGAEKALMTREHITHLVSKNAGGEQTEAKLDAARELGLPVIMIRRPCKPSVTSFASADMLCEELARLLSP